MFKVIRGQKGEIMIEFITRIGGVVESGVVGGGDKEIEHVSYIFLTQEQADELCDKLLWESVTRAKVEIPNGN